MLTRHPAARARRSTRRPLSSAHLAIPWLQVLEKLLCLLECKQAAQLLVQGTIRTVLQQCMRAKDVAVWRACGLLAPSMMAKAPSFPALDIALDATRHDPKDPVAKHPGCREAAGMALCAVLRVGPKLDFYKQVRPSSPSPTLSALSAASAAAALSPPSLTAQAFTGTLPLTAHPPVKSGCHRERDRASRRLAGQASRVAC